MKAEKIKSNKFIRSGEHVYGVGSKDCSLLSLTIRFDLVTGDPKFKLDPRDIITAKDRRGFLIWLDMISQDILVRHGIRLKKNLIFTDMTQWQWTDRDAAVRYKK